MYRQKDLLLPVEKRQVPDLERTDKKGVSLLQDKAGSRAVQTTEKGYTIYFQMAVCVKWIRQLNQMQEN